jgi:hypothetical protein
MKGKFHLHLVRIGWNTELTKLVWGQGGTLSLHSLCLGGQNIDLTYIV